MSDVIITLQEVVKRLEELTGRVRFLEGNGLRSTVPKIELGKLEGLSSDKSPSITGQITAEDTLCRCPVCCTPITPRQD